MSVSEAIARLTSAELPVRSEAAAELYRTGRGSAELAVAPWLANAEIAALLLYPNPEITVGVAVSPEMFAAIRSANGKPPLSEVPPEQDAQEFELSLAGGISLDILTSREPAGSGAIARYLQKFGGGVQQVEFRCRDVDRATALVSGNFDIAPVYPQTRPGANATRINFFLAATDSGKVLIELYETATAA
jgi:hypothetical protein